MNILQEVYTFAEATELWKLPDSTIRVMISRGKLVEGVEYRKAGKIGLITKFTMERLFGKLPPK